MTKGDMPRLARVLAVLAETFNETVSDLRADGYMMGLNDLTIDQVESAARLALKESKFFPRPAELRELAVGSSDDRAELSWLELVAEVRRVGSYQLPSRLSAETLYAAEKVWGSWQRLCETLPSDGPEFLGWAKRFKNAYGVLTHPSRRQIESRHTVPLLDTATHHDDDDVPL